MEIPKSCFTSEQEIKVYQSDEQTAFGAESVSGQFYIKGLPDTYSKPLRISIKYSGSLANESYIAFGDYYYCHSPVDTIQLYKMLPAEDSSGYLVSYISPVVGGKANTPRYQGVWGLPVCLISNYYTYTTNHFQIRFPFQYSGVQGVEEIGDGLEGAFDSLTKWTFRNSRTKYPIEVTIMNLPPKVYGQGGREAPYGVNDGVIQINSGIMNNHELCRTIGAHEYFHLVLGYYSESHDYDWPQDACCTWFESYFANNPSTYLSPTRAGREGAPFDGLQAGIVSFGADEHGYGASSVIKYIAKTWGIDAIRMIWEAEYSQGQTPCNGMRQQTALYTEWWGDFLNEYFLGNIYSDMGPQWASVNSGTTLRTETDTVFSFKKSFPDLSGYIYRVELEYTGFKEESSLQLALSGAGSGMYVYSLTGSNLTLLGSSRYSYTINGLKELQTSGAKIYILIYNDHSNPPNYLGSSDITLSGKVSNSMPPDFTSAYVRIDCRTSYTWVCPGSTYDQEDGFSLYSHTMNGSFTGNVFTGSYDDQNYSDSVTITLDPVLQRIVSMNIRFHLTQPNGDYLDKTATCSNIPYYTSGGNGITYYSINGIETCNRIDELTGIGTFQGCTRTLNNYWCTTDGLDNLIEVKFMK
ncbi:MAG: hypothetical protein IPH84_14380 [Bacteroidales bacterium]|nr:hypothetical protein [Bacteroidales bacterium]